MHYDNYNLHCVISIHALLAESDHAADISERRGASISIHALLAESDGGSGVGSWPRVIFLSTLSLRRATKTFPGIAEAMAISIHALLAESDTSLLILEPSAKIFLSTLSLRRATFEYIQAGTGILFLSTLSLRRATALTLSAV